MKKLLILISVLSLGNLLNAQGIPDAYRYSKSELTGTARYIAMGGAFGALGGDLSAVSANPASSAVFLSSSASISLGYRGMDNNLTFNNSGFISEESSLDLGNIGGVFVFTGNGNSDWKKFSFGANLQTSSVFDENYAVSGRSTNSIDQYFLNYANGYELELLKKNGQTTQNRYASLGEVYGFGAQQAFLGYQGFIIEPEVDNQSNTNYYSLIRPGNFDQEYYYNATGLNGKLSFNAATQYKDFLYLGVNLNSHFVNYETSREFYEVNDNFDPNDTEISTTEVYFANNLAANGDGFSFQIGGIAKLNENIRVGLTYDSPAWYNIREESSQVLESGSESGDYDIVNPNVVNIYPAYRLKTAPQITGSIAYLFGQKGLLSFDYARKDYSSIQFKPSNDEFYSQLNADISDVMQASSIFRLGGEYRIERFSLRGGYRFEQSPFKNELRASNVTGYSGGIGYNFGNINLDLAYSLTTYDNNDPVFETGYTNAVTANRDLSRIMVTLNFGL